MLKIFLVIVSVSTLLTYLHREKNQKKILPQIFPNITAVNLVFTIQVTV
ncbi:MAG: hypothetical protein ACYCVH_06690 [Ignavibacteriaceae bacterium]